MNPVLAIIENSYDVLLDAAPYILLGTILAGVLHAFLRAERLQRWLAAPDIASVLKAALVGAPLPLCSCSVLPVALQLRRAGASRPATAAFLVTTPETGVDSVVLTAGLMNPIFAAARVVGAVITGIVAGALQILVDKGSAEQPAPATGETGGSCCKSSCCGESPAAEAKPAGMTDRFLRGQHYAFTDLLPSMAHWYLIGILATGIAVTLLPDGFLQTYLGGGIGGMLLMAVAGMAVYICASSATPLVAALVMKGMSPGTALVLLLAGPATSIASMIAVRGMLGARGLVAYVGAIMVCAVGAGLAFDAIIAAFALPMVIHQGHAHQHTFGVVAHVIAIGMLVYMAYWLWRAHGPALLPRGRTA